MHAVICGAGLDGLTLAMRLAQGGWAVSILHNVPSHARSGYLVELAGEGLSAAQQMGVLPALVEAAECISRVRWVDARGKSIADVHVGHKPGDESEEPLHLLRENFERILLQSLPSSIRVYAGVDVREVRTQAECVELTLSSGESLRCDLLVGADGGNSPVRELVFGHEGLWRRPLGHHSAAFVFEDADIHYKLAGHLTVLSAPGRLLTLCPLRDGHVAATFAFRTVSRVRPSNPSKWLEVVFGDLKWCTPAVLEHASKVETLHYDRATQIKTSTWYRARVALLGDACYAYSLLPGQGCSAGIAAAFELGTVLVRGASFATAFDWYDAQLAQEVAGRRTEAKRIADWLMPDSLTDLIVRNGLLRMASVPGLRRFVRPAGILAT
jgi:2-polyprenyl-6-methoxyphenol hydroxylase-like FAD-dependent oxidoreductase